MTDFQYDDIIDPEDLLPTIEENVQYIEMLQRSINDLYDQVEELQKENKWLKDQLKSADLNITIAKNV